MWQWKSDRLTKKPVLFTTFSAIILKRSRTLQSLLHVERGKSYSQESREECKQHNKAVSQQIPNRSPSGLKKGEENIRSGFRMLTKRSWCPEIQNIKQYKLTLILIRKSLHIRFFFCILGIRTQLPSCLNPTTRTCRAERRPQRTSWCNEPCPRQCNRCSAPGRGTD